MSIADGGGTRIVVMKGGPVAPDELAALVVALTPVEVSSDEAPVQMPAWRRAARLEGVGERPSVSAADLAWRRT